MSTSIYIAFLSHSTSNALRLVNRLTLVKTKKYYAFVKKNNVRKSEFVKKKSQKEQQSRNTLFKITQ